MRSFDMGKVLGIVIVVFTVILLAYGFSHQGLFYRSDYVVTGLLISLIAMTAIPILVRQSKKALPLWTWLLVGYSLYVAVTCTWGSDRTLSVTGAVAINSAVLLAIVTSLLGFKLRKTLLEVIILTGPILYFFAMLVATGRLSYTQAIEGTMMDSVFQYHNVFGAYELACFIMALVLSVYAVGVRKLYYTAVASISFLGLALSYSRWVWLDAVFITALFLISMIVGKRILESLLSLVMALVLVGAQFSFALKVIQTHSSRMLVYSVICLVGITAIYFGVQVVMKKVFLPTWARYAGLGMLLSVAVGIGAYLSHGHLTPILSRIHQIRLSDNSLQERLWYYGAAIKMWIENPVFGTGYGTWPAKYQAFQQFTYATTMTHSSLMENLTNFGLIGTALWISAIGLTVVAAFRRLANDPQEGPLRYAALFGAGAILAHSLFDFDLDYVLLLYVFWTLLAAASPAQHQKSTANWHVLSAAYAPALIICAFGVGMTISEHELNSFSASKASTTQGIQLLNKATTWAPYNAGAQYALAQLLLKDYSVTGDQTKFTNSWTHLQAAARYGKWNSELQEQCAATAYSMGHYNEALTWARRGAEDAPYQFGNILTYQSIGLWVGIREWKQNPEAATEIFNEVSKAYSNAQDRRNGLDKLPHSVHPEWWPHITVGMQVYAGAAKYCLGEFKQSQTAINPLISSVGDQGTQELYEITTLLNQVKLHRISLQDAKLQVPNEQGAQDLFNALADINQTE